MPGARAPRSAATAPARGDSPRGSMWDDVRQGARIARAQRVTLTVHGIEIVGSLRRSPRRSGMCNKQPACMEPDMPKLLSAAGDDSSPPPLSKRKQRSTNRLKDFQRRKRNELLAQFPRVQALLRQYRWQRVQNVWTEWKRIPMEQSMEEDARQGAKRARAQP